MYIPHCQPIWTFDIVTWWSWTITVPRAWICLTKLNTLLSHLVQLLVLLTEICTLNCYMICIATSMSFTVDALKLTSALRALEELDLELLESSGDAVQELLFIPTLTQLKLKVVSDHVTTVSMFIGFGPDCSVYLPIPALLHWVPVKPSSQVRVTCYTVGPVFPLWRFCLPW